MANIIISGCVDQFTRLRISMNRSEAEIAHMIGTAGFIQQNIPVCPPHGSVIKIIDHGVAIAFSIRPIFVMIISEALSTSFGKDQFLVRVGFGHII